jgi:hypothetical protein
MLAMGERDGLVLDWKGARNKSVPYYSLLFTSSAYVAKGDQMAIDVQVLLEFAAIDE